jgi:hypothetical protein
LRRNILQLDDSIFAFERGLLINEDFNVHNGIDLSMMKFKKKKLEKCLNKIMHWMNEYNNIRNNYN